MRASRFLLASVLPLAFGCATASAFGDRAGGATAPSSKGTPPQIAAGGDVCRPAPPKAAPTDRDRAVDAFVAGSLRDAIDVLSKRVQAAPNDLAAQALLVASKTRADIASRKNAAALEKLPVVALGGLTGDAQAVGTIAGATPGAPLKIDRVSDKPVDVLASTDDWLKKNGLRPTSKRPGPDDLPEGAPQALGARASALYSHADHEIVRYETTLLVVAPGRTPLLFDAGALDEVHFAQVVGRALIVASWRNGYAKEVGGKTGHVAAFSIETGKLIWSSEPLVTTSAGFVVTKDHVVTGYGFTAEPDNLFALELATGKTVQKLQLRSGPDFILRRDDRIFVRTYDSEAVFRMSPDPGAAKAADLAVRSDGATAMSADASCWVTSAVAAIDARDPRALQAAIDGLKASGAAADVAGAFDGVQAFLDQQSGGSKAIDLTTATAKKLAPPPWAYKLVRAATGPVSGKPKLVDKGSRPADPARGVRARGGRVDPSKPFFLAPVDMGRLPPGARPDIPSTYGLLHLSAAIPQGDRLVLIYGGRYVAVVKGSDTEAIFDFEAWLKPPRVNEQWKEFAVSDVTFAMAEGDVLFVGNGGGSYAREMGGTKGFMSAIDLKTGELLWRSQPLVHGGGAFAFFKGFIMTGYGFTDEPDNVFLLRKDTGDVVHKVPVKSAPGSITLSGNVATVETYDAVHEIEIRE